MQPAPPFPPIEESRKAFVAGLGPADRVDSIYWGSGGLFLADGSPDPRAAAPMPGTPPLSAASMRDADRIPKALFCGRYRSHFGHFLAESLGRLWAAALVGPGVPLMWLADPREARSDGTLRATVLDYLGIANPVITVTGITKINRLLIPPSLNDPLHAVPAAVAFHDWLAACLPPPPPPGADLYISRTRLADSAGRFLGEAAIESGLAAQGYRILHPQDLSFAEQVQAYRAARRIVLAEGSPIHLLAMLDIPGQRVAMLRRRPRTVASIPPTLASFRRASVTHVTRDVRSWGATADRSILFRIVSELDMPAVWADLAAAGFIDGTAHPVPTPAQIDAERAARAADRPVLLAPQAP